MRKKLISCALLAVSLFTAPVFAENPPKPTASQTQVAAFERLAVTINKSPNDRALYQAIRLNNGMEVLLISDEKANKSLMSAGIAIGSMEDPMLQQGLAHYLEHMILMGSKRFPETNSLDTFLTKNGGYNNAFTMPDRTVYFLEVNNNAFDEAVDRLADALAQPLLAETNAKKEVNAVNAEMVRAKSSDGFLMQDVGLATSNPAHPMTKFAVGNSVTLSDKPDSKLIPELRKFYETYYSAGLTKVVLYSNQSIEQLAKLAERTLSNMPNLNITEPRVSVPLLREQDNSVIVHYKPVKPQKMLVVSFDMPEDKAAFKQKSGEYLAYVFGNNSDGTLSDYLIKNGLSDTGVGAYPSADVSRNRGEFSFYIELTEKGLSEKDKVISLLFQQIENVKRAGIQTSYFNELKESLHQEFQHLQTEKNGFYVAKLASKMLSYPLEHIIDQPYLVENMDEAAIRAKLDLMTLENARILVVDEKAKTDKKTRYFEAPYAVAKISEQQKSQWSDFSHNPVLKLPAMNPYFVTDFSLNPTDKNREIPLEIEKGKATRVFAMGSRHFAIEPKANVQINFVISPENDELKNEVAAKLLNDMYDLVESRKAFQGNVAGIRADLSVGNNDLSLEVEGYTQHLVTLLGDLLADFHRFELTEDALQQVKSSYLESLAREENDNALRQALVLKKFANFPHFETASKREMIEKLRLDDIKQMRTRLLNQATGLTALSVGNLSDEQVKQLVSTLSQTVKNQDSALDYGRYLDVNQSSRKLNYIKQIPHQDNALVASYLPNGYEEFAGAARALLLKEIISSWYFDDLRSDKQLGYVVYATHTRIGKTAGLQFSVQSPTASTETIMQHNVRYFAETETKLKAMSLEEIEKYRASLLEVLQHKPESLHQEFEEFLEDFDLGNEKFNHKAELIKQIKALNKDDLITFFRDAVIEQKAFVLLSQAVGTNSAINQPLEPTGFEKVESIEQFQKQFELKAF